MRSFPSNLVAFALVLSGAVATSAAQGLTVQANRPAGVAMQTQSAVKAVPNAAVPAAPAPAKGLQVISTAAELAARAPAAHPEDVATPEAIVAATYAVISGPPGPRDWDRFRSLFLPTGRLSATAKKPDGTRVVAEMSPDEYVTRDAPYFQKNGFFERALKTKWERFGSMAQGWSSYVSRHTPDGEPFARGINSFQLLNDGTRWWVVSIAWNDETSGEKLPAEMEK